MGKSHVSDKSGAVRHSLLWIQMLCEERGLTVREVSNSKYDFGTQKWLVIEQQNGRKYFTYGNIANSIFPVNDLYMDFVSWQSHIATAMHNFFNFTMHSICYLKY